MAVVGTTIMYLDGTPYNSPEFGRGGLAATFAVDVTQWGMTGATQFDIVVEHRNSEDQTFSVAGAFAAINTPGVYTLDVTGLKEIVRFTYAISGGTPMMHDAIHYLMMPPSWRPY